MKKTFSPLISIIIPTYNRADLIARAIQSVLDQSYENWELIVVDNYSDDNTSDVISAFNDNRILMLSTPRTGSVAASRNLGVSRSNGEWIAFLDSDDWWFPKKLEFVCKTMKEKPDLIYHNLQIVTSDGTPLNKTKAGSRKLKAPCYLDLLLNGNTISLSSVVVRKTTFLRVGGMNESPTFLAVEDYDTWLRIAQITNRFKFINRVLGAYRLHDGNLSTINNFQYLSNALEYHLRPLNLRQFRRFQSLYIYQIARSKYKSKEFSETARNLVFVVKFGHPRYAFRALTMLMLNSLFRVVLPEKNFKN
jgi:glycosyltransferase involved in cell wall biosynthesis